LHFWVKLSNLMECRVVESEVRESINLLLEKAKPATTNVPGVAGPAPLPVSGGILAPLATTQPAGLPVPVKPADNSIAGKVAAATESRLMRKAG